MLKFLTKKQLLASAIVAIMAVTLPLSVCAEEQNGFISDACTPDSSDVQNYELSIEQEDRKEYGTAYSLDLPSKKEIAEKYFELGMDKTASTVYSESYSMSAPYDAGALSSSTLNQALNTVNFIRFTAGLDDVALNDEYNNLTQHASLVNAVNGSLSHNPAQPSDMSDDIYALGYEGASSSNIGMGYTSIPDSIIRGYMEDTDYSNISRVGHRRWILNPPMQEIGFGMVGRFTATYAFDNWYNGYLTDDFIAWPPQNMPQELYVPNSLGYAFSLNLGNDYDTPSLDDVSVTVYSELQNKTWRLDSSCTSDITNYLNVENSNYGMSKCIIFNVGSFADYDNVTVTVNGIYKNGVHSPITYTVDFFSVYDDFGLTAPEITKTEIAGTNSVNVLWNPVSDAVSYKVYRSESISGVKSYLGETTATSFVDSTSKTSGQTYYYFVVSCKNGKTSEYSEAKSIAFYSMPAPVLTKAEIAGTNSVTITWDAVEGATSYRVYRATSITGAKTMLKVVAGTSFTDSTAKTNGQTYYYTLKAYSSKTTALSGFSASKSVKFYSMPAPVLTKAEISGTNSVTITWDAVEGATSYRVYRATSTTGAKTMLKVVAGTSFTDSTAKADGQTYYYTLKAYSSKTTALSGFSASKSVKFYSMPAPTITSATTSGSGVTIKWNSIDSATSYRVYRATSLGGTKTLLKVTEATSYTDTTAKSGTTYYYSLKAYNSTTTALSGFSASSSAKA